MSDQHASLRDVPLVSIFAALGVKTEWRTRKNGTEWWGKCPFHSAKRNNNSFSFDSSGRMHCFSCGMSGRGSIDAVMKFKRVGFHEAVDVLKTLNVREHAVDTSTRPVHDSPENAHVSANQPFKATYHKYFVPSAWLSERGFEPRTLDRFGVGEYDNPARTSQYKGKILLPVKRWSDSELVGYLARNPKPSNGEAKYIWPKGFHKALEVFGAVQLREDHTLPVRVVYLVESPFAVMKFWQLGVPTISCFGWSVSPAQAEIIRQLAKGILFLPDLDKRKEAAAVAGLLSTYCWVKMPQMPDGVSDPESLTEAQIRSLA